MAGAACVCLMVMVVSCSKKELGPANPRTLRYMPDPYLSIPAPGEAPLQERAAALMDQVGKDLGYGSIPGDVLRAEKGKPWATRQTLLLAHGTTEGLRTAWIDVVDTWTESSRVSQESKFELHMGLGRVWDLEGAKADEELLRKAYLAEIAYGYTLLDRDKRAAKR